MRKIKIMKWKESNRDDPDKEIEVDTCSLLRNMVMSVPPQKLPTGLDAFTIMRSLDISLKTAKGKEYLHLEDNVFDWLDKNCFTNILAVWGLMDEVAMAIIEITNSKQYDPNVAEEENKDESEEKRVAEALPEKPG